MTREIRLVDLELRGFKGSSAFRLELDGRSAIVRGDNATGKTTLHDAYAWLLFGKDATNRTAFEIKTLTGAGQAIAGVDHEVRATFSIDGELVTLRRVYRETWTKKRGSSTAELTGHSTDFEVDGVPVKKKEWLERLDDLFGPEDQLRLLTDPLYFASLLPWDQRRRILLELVGDVPEKDVEALEPELVELRKAIGKRSHDEHQKVLLARRKETNVELDRLPVRVDEAARSLEGAPAETPEQLAALVDAARARLAELEAASSPAGEIVQARAELAAARKRLERIRVDVAGERTRAKAAAVEAGRRADAEVARADARYRRAESSIDRLVTDVGRTDRALETLRGAYAEARLEEPAVQVADVCPCCSRPLEADAVDEARRKATAEANAQKAARIRQIGQEGQAARARRLELSRELGAAEAELEAAETELETAKAAREDAERYTVPEAPELAEAGTLLEIEQLETALERAQAGHASADASASTQEAREKLGELLEALARSQDAGRARERIDELEAKERELALEIERVDRELYLLDLRARARARILTERVDEHFELVRFRLFTEQINGALAEACDVTVDGVPWGDLNHGARMNAGLDVLRALGTFYGLRAPVWLDNAESVTTWRDAGAQTIRLEVDGTAPELEVDVLPA